MPSPAVCPRCANPFECGVDTGGCWCKDVVLDNTTRAAFAEYYDGCLCRDCLTAMQGRPPTPSVREFLTAQLKRQRQRR